MAFELPYYLYKRSAKGVEYWYVRFKNLETGEIMAGKSIEQLRKKMKYPGRHHVKNKMEADRIAQHALDSGFINFGEVGPTFKDYILDFWDFHNSLYIQRKNKKCPNSIGLDYANNMRNTFKKNAEPLIPTDLRLRDVQTEHVEHVLNCLLDEGKKSNATIAKVMYTMSGPLKEARRLKMINQNPMDGIESVTIRSKQRGILTSSELQELLSKMLHGVEKEEIHNLVYLATALSAFTGMRQGEIRALHASSISLINEEHGIIVVKEAYASYSGLKGTKGKRERQVPVPRWLCDKLVESANYNPYGNDLVFWSDTSSTAPITSNFIRDNFYKALHLIKIDEDKRIERNLTFHSLRHYFVTFMRGKISESELREIAGHQSQEMTDRYTHATVENLLQVGQVANNIFQFPNKKERTA